MDVLVSHVHPPAPRYFGAEAAVPGPDLPAGTCWRALVAPAPVTTVGEEVALLAQKPAAAAEVLLAAGHSHRSRLPPAPLSRARAHWWWASAEGRQRLATQIGPEHH